MRTIYLVKKNPEVQGDQDNWITMNSYEFAMFMKTEEGKRRRDFFGEMDAVDEHDYRIIMECDLKGAQRLKCEKRRKQYIREVESKSRYKVISMNELKESDDRSLEETELMDINVNVEERAIEGLMISKLKDALDMLDDEERELIWTLYLSDHCMTATEYAKLKGVTYRAVTHRKEKIFEKIKEILVLSIQK